MKQEGKPNRRRSRIIKVVSGILLLLLLGIGYTAISIYAYGRQTSHDSADAAIVLGAAVWGEEPSPVFRERINHALILYRTGRVRKLIFTGGIGKGTTIAEAEAAKRFAIEK